MTMTWAEWELQEEVSSESRFREPPPIRDDVAKMPPIPAAGWGEIKPHNLNGIEAGLTQLRDHPSTDVRLLITYRPVDATGAAVDTGQPENVEVYLTSYTPTTPNKLLTGQKWWFLGTLRSPKRITVKVDNRGLYGAIIESAVRGLFRKTALKPPRVMQKGTGGAGKGADIVWRELADMYRELAGELRDPFYAELAVALAPRA